MAKAQEFWHYGSKRAYETKHAHAGRDAVGEFAGHTPPKDDSVLEVSRLFYEAAHPRADQQPPAAIRDLAVRRLDDGQAEVTFTAPADDSGRAARYQVKAAALPIVAYEAFDYARDAGQKCNWWRAVNCQAEPPPQAARHSRAIHRPRPPGPAAPALRRAQLRRRRQPQRPEQRGRGPVTNTIQFPAVRRSMKAVTMNPRYVLRFASLVCFAVTPAATAAERPNVIFIAVDDLNDWLGGRVGINYVSQWGSKFGGLPFHLYIYAKYARSRRRRDSAGRRGTPLYRRRTAECRTVQPTRSTGAVRPAVVLREAQPGQHLPHQRQVTT